MRERLLTLVLSAALGLSLLPDALAEEPYVALPVPASHAAETAALEEPGGEEPARLLADGEPDYAGAAEALRAGIVQRQERVYIDDYHIPATQDAANDLLLYLRYRYGAFFDLSDAGKYRTNGTYLISFTPAYTMTDEEYAAAKDFYDRKLNAIVAQIPENAADAEKVLFIHDYLAAHYEYDNDFQNDDAYSFLKEGKGVCQAYMLTFSALMDKLGIPVSYVESDILNHAWNVVELDGMWYHVDVTWDDPAIGSQNTPSADVLGAVRHEFFLLSDETDDALRAEWAETAQIQGYEKDFICGEDYIRGERVVTCPDKTYETGIYADADSPVVYVAGDDSWYYLSTDSGDKGLYRWREGQTEAERLGDYSAVYSGGIAPLTEYEGSLFFSTPEAICRYELATGTMTTLFTQTNALAAPLSGIQIAGGALSYKLRVTGEMTAFDRDILPWHDAGAFSYYYNFGAVGLRPGDRGQALIAWYDPDSGQMARLTAAEAQGSYGVPVADRDLTCAVFVLADDGTLAPIQRKFTLHSAQR